MNSAIIVQLIETFGIIVAPVLGLLVAYFLLRQLIRIRERYTHEHELLQDVIFYRAVIDKYEQFCKSQPGINLSKKNEFWREVREESALQAPTRTTPSKIEARLKELDMLTKELESVLDKLGP